MDRPQHRGMWDVGCGASVPLLRYDFWSCFAARSDSTMARESKNLGAFIGPRLQTPRTCTSGLVHPRPPVESFVRAPGAMPGHRYGPRSKVKRGAGSFHSVAMKTDIDKVGRPQHLAVSVDRKAGRCPRSETLQPRIGRRAATPAPLPYRGSASSRGDRVTGI